MRPTMFPRRQTPVNGASAGPPVLARATTSSGQTPVSKAHACFQALLKGDEKPPPYDPKDPERFYFDLFCLSVESTTLLALATEVTDDQLVDSGEIKNNIRELFLYTVRCLKISEHDDLRLPNVIEILRTILRSFLSRQLPNYSYDVMNLLAGSLEQADAIFPDFVASLDDILSNAETTPELKENTMSLALLVVTSINQGSVNSYFLRRDLFSTVIKLVSDPSTAHLAAESFLMLSVLANYHKYAARNAMLVRFEDLVDEGIMKRVREAASTALIQCRDAYVHAMDDSPPTFASNMASIMSTFRLIALPVKPSVAQGAPVASSEGIFLDQPLELASILLPIYDLVNSNKAFSSFLLHDKIADASDEPEFIPALVSLTSYLATHSAVSPRTRAYGRLSFIIITLLVEEGAQLLMSRDAASMIRICRQRQPALPAVTAPRPTICSILDTIVQYLKFNITRKKFDVQTYLLVLRLAHKCMHHLKTARTRINYDWQPLFHSLISLASFLVARQVELSDIAEVDDLIAQVLLTLDFAIVWADVILPDAEAIAQLLYEVLRAEVTLSKLGSLTTSISTPPAVVTASPRLGPTSPSIRRNSSSGLATPKSPSLASTPTFAAAMSPLEVRGPVADSIRNLSVVSSHFGNKVEDCREKSRSAIVDSQQILTIIKSSMDGLDLRESMALEEIGMRRYNEAEQEAYFAELVPIVAKDILRLSSI